MRHVLSMLLLLLLCVQHASGRAVLQPENCVRESFAISYWNYDASSQDFTGENGLSGYDLASDVCDGPNLYAYCSQNPWTKFDPHGLSGVTEILSKYQRTKAVQKLISEGKPIKKINGAYPKNAHLAGRRAGIDDLSAEAQNTEVAKYLKTDKKFKGVQWKDTGFPDFTQYSAKFKGQTDFQFPGKLTGDTAHDTTLLKDHLRSMKVPDSEIEYALERGTVHHVEDGKTLQIVRWDVHEAFEHTGGRAVLKEESALSSATSAVAGFVAPYSQKAFSNPNSTATDKAKAIGNDIGANTGAGGVVEMARDYCLEKQKTWYNNFSNFLLPGSGDWE
jgi:hypothetical protein